MPHFMPSDHRLGRLYLFAPSRANRYAEMCVAIDEKGLACVMDDVGRGYSRAAEDAFNACRGASTSMPWACARSVPQELALFSLADGWHKLDLVAFPRGYIQGASLEKSSWQLLALDEAAGWAPVGLIDPNGGRAVFRAHGASLGEPQEPCAALAGVTANGLLTAQSLPQVGEYLASIREESSSHRERMVM